MYTVFLQFLTVFVIAEKNAHPPYLLGVALGPGFIVHYYLFQRYLVCDYCHSS
jgi:hypothetical protein